jgi:hypothetical protein
MRRSRSLRPGPSSEHRPVLGMSDCERIASGVLKQPVNAVTSLAYGAAAAVMLVPVRRGHGRHRVALGLYAASLVAVSIGSVAYHGPQPRWASRAHDASVAASIAATLLVAMTARRRASGRVPGRLPAALVLATLAGAAHRAGRTQSRWCNPESVAQLHGLWHVLSAGSALALAWMAGTGAVIDPADPLRVERSRDSADTR